MSDQPDESGTEAAPRWPCSCGGSWPIRHLHADEHTLLDAPDNPATSSDTADNAELTAEEARNLVDELSTDLYRAQDALAFVEECCVIADREGRQPTTADVREWLKGARCGRQLATDPGYAEAIARIQSSGPAVGYDGPSVAEAAKDDRAHWADKYAGE